MTNKAEEHETPQTGDKNYGFLIGIGAVILGGIVSSFVILRKSKKDEDDD